MDLFRSLAALAAITGVLLVVGCGDQRSSLDGRRTNSSAIDYGLEEGRVSAAEAERAAAIALEEVGGGRISSLERGDDGAGYEIELLSPEGEVELTLDSDFRVIEREVD